MNSAEIDRLIERYAEERKHETRQVAQAHFLTYAYLVCKTSEIEPFLKHIRSLLVYHIDSMSLFDNPFRNSQVCWLLLMSLWFSFGVYLMTDSNLRLVGMIYCAATVIFGTSLWKIIWNKWLDTSLLIAYYREIIDFIDNQRSFEANA